MRKGFRGYVSSRPLFGNRTPQHVQNLVIRDYCRQAGVIYLLSATEYAMNGSYIILEQVVKEMPALEGVVLYSIFQLPGRRAYRHSIYQRILESGATIHTALEGLVIDSAVAVREAEDIYLVQKSLPFCPVQVGRG